MKDFFENFGKRFGETAEMVTNKAGEMIEIQRVKSQIRDLARENAVDMMELGKACMSVINQAKNLTIALRRFVIR